MAVSKPAVSSLSSSCGCAAAKASRKALAVDPQIKSSNLKRLRRIEGQIRGLQRLVREDRYCADILVQISSVQQALRSVGRALMRNHLKYCASEAIRNGSPGRADAMYEELLDLMDQHTR
jgi:DNA-binding FrmR family transcriptional regulator